jgi:hypothetical protein
MTIEVKELREAERYVFDAPLSASYGAVELIIVNVSEGGLQALHPAPMRIGSSSRLSFRAAGVIVGASGRLLWSHLSKEPDTNGKMLYRSGIRIEDPAFAEAVRALVDKGFVKPDSNSLERKRKRLIEKEKSRSGPQMKVIVTEATVPPEQLLLIKQVRERLRTNPLEANRLYEQARTADAAKGVQQDVLAVWEYLERSISLPLIMRVFDGKA